MYVFTVILKNKKILPFNILIAFSKSQFTNDIVV